MFIRVFATDQYRLDLPADEHAAHVIAESERILRTLPQWFGIEAALRDYANSTAVLPTWFAEQRGEVAGFLTLVRHFESSWEIHCMAVAAASRGGGVGRALVEAAVDAISCERAGFLHVKTLSQSHESVAYAQTRSFYAALGFAPLLKLPEYWSVENPCLVMLRKIDPAAQRVTGATSA